MDFASIRMITDDLEPMVQFCEQVTDTPAARPRPSSPSCACRRAPSPSATPRRRSCSTTRPAQPTLFLCGDNDACTPQPMSEEIAEAIPAAEVVVLPGGGHLIELEREEEYFQIASSFIDCQGA
jgi:pimeloyl-ACP methyl ester carboxylesterase